MHIRCPHCQHAVEVVGTEEFASVTCPSCGSSFDLVPPTKSFWLSKRKIGHFELLDQLGTGGFGTVWKARDTKLDRLVAIKVPRVDHSDPEHAELFLREARAAAQLRHPQIVAVHEVGRDDGTLYIVSDFVQGITLADRLTTGPFPPREAAELLAQVAEALHHAHEAGVIHRDLKPQNIMLDGQGHPLLMDFGLAKREAGEITMTIDGKVLGTPAYMSPEQARGEGHRVDRRTDVYSLGVILFELLTGERPFRGNTRMLLHQVIHDDPPSPRKLNSRVPRDLETICLKCLEKEAHKRYATAQDFAAELQRYISGQPIHARPVGRVERSWRWARRNPVIAALSAIIIVMLPLAAVVSTFFAVGERIHARAEVILRRQAYRNYYAAEINLAQRDWEAGAVDNALMRLDRISPNRTGNDELRGFEWFYWDRRCRANLLTIDAFHSHASSIAFNHDGTRIVGGGWPRTSDDNLIKVWDADTGKELLALKGHSGGDTGFVRSVAFNNDSTRIVSGNSEGLVNVYDARRGKQLLSLKGYKDSPVSVGSVAFSQNGTRIVSECDVIKIWDAATGQELLTLRDGGFSNVVFSRDGTRIVGSSGNTVKVWVAASGKELLTLKGHTDYVGSVAFNHDGTRIASGSKDGTIRVWDATSGQELLTLKGVAGFVISVAFSHDGTRIVSGGNETALKVWDAAGGQELLTLKRHGRHSFAVTSVAFNHNGTRIASAEQNGLVRVFDTTGGQETLTLQGQQGSVHSLAFSFDGTRIVSGGGNGTIKMWDAASGHELLALKGHTAAAGGPAKIWDAASGQELLVLKEATGRVSVAFSRDGTRIASGSDDGTVKVWDAVSGRELLTLKPEHEGNLLGFVKSVAFNHNGTKIVSGYYGSTIKIWDAVGGKELLSLAGYTDIITSVAFNYDGTRIVGGGYGRTVRVWNATSGKELLTLKGHSGYVNSVAFNNDGTRIVSGGSEGTIKVWDALGGRELLTLRGHAEDVFSVAFNRSGTRIVSGSNDRVVKVWDAVSGHELLSLKGHAGAVLSVAISRDGMRIVSGDTLGIIKIWNARPRSAPVSGR